MPIQKTTVSQKQRRIFEQTLEEQLDRDHKLYKLRSLINWKDLESKALSILEVKNLGRARKDNRILLGLVLLQSMNNGSDAYAVEELRENFYWQYFCGYEYLQKKVEVSETTLRRFRNILGEDGHSEILKELCYLGIKVGAIKKKTWTQRLLIRPYKIRISNILMMLI